MCVEGSYVHDVFGNPTMHQDALSIEHEAVGQLGKALIEEVPNVLRVCTEHRSKEVVPVVQIGELVVSPQEYHTMGALYEQPQHEVHCLYLGAPPIHVIAEEHHQLEIVLLQQPLQML